MKNGINYINSIIIKGRSTEQHLVMKARCTLCNRLKNNTYKIKATADVNVTYATHCDNCFKITEFTLEKKVKRDHGGNRR